MASPPIRRMEIRKPRRAAVFSVLMDISVALRPLPHGRGSDGSTRQQTKHGDRPECPRGAKAAPWDALVGPRGSARMGAHGSNPSRDREGAVLFLSLIHISE